VHQEGRLTLDEEVSVHVVRGKVRNWKGLEKIRDSLNLVADSKMGSRNQRRKGGRRPASSPGKMGVKEKRPRCERKKITRSVRIVDRENKALLERDWCNGPNGRRGGLLRDQKLEETIFTKRTISKERIYAPGPLDRDALSTGRGSKGGMEVIKC